MLLFEYWPIIFPTQDIAASEAYCLVLKEALITKNPNEPCKSILQQLFVHYELAKTGETGPKHDMKFLRDSCLCFFDTIYWHV